MYIHIYISIYTFPPPYNSPTSSEVGGSRRLSLYRIYEVAVSIQSWEERG